VDRPPLQRRLPCSCQTSVLLPSAPPDRAWTASPLVSRAFWHNGRLLLAVPLLGAGTGCSYRLQRKTMDTSVSRAGVKRADEVFFTGMSVLMLLIVSTGFAPSYFLRGMVFAQLPSLLVHFHGALFSAWIILFVVQSSLISTGHVRLHRKLGVLGALIAGLMVVLGVLATFGTLRRGDVLPSFLRQRRS
jgi:hypothetical protein